MKRAVVFLLCLAGCALTPAQQAQVQAHALVALKVACQVDGIVIPIAQPIVASLGPTGAAISAADLLVHPTVVAACAVVNGIPVTVTLN